MITIAFLLLEINVRGTTQASLDYAIGNVNILGNKSILIAPKSNKHDMKTVERLGSILELYFYDNLESIIVDQNISAIHILKHGQHKNNMTSSIPVFVHCVFDMSNPHGSVYAGVSKTIADKYNSGLYVPHMIGLKPTVNGINLRNFYNIPTDAIVIGRYGGMDTFNIPWVWDVISNLVNTYTNIWFLFANTPKIVNHSRVVYIPMIRGDSEKNGFINTCDCYLEASTLGHSFGLAIGEFDINDKPILMYNGWVWNNEHHRIMGDRGMYFKTAQELLNTILRFTKNTTGSIYDGYKKFTPEKVMPIFKKVFLDKIFK